MKKLKFILGLLILAIVFTIIINVVVSSKSRPYIFSAPDKVPKCYTGIVLGTLVSKSGTPSDFLQDRMDVALQLYNSGKIKRLLLSGDHGRKVFLSPVPYPLTSNFDQIGVKFVIILAN